MALKKINKIVIIDWNILNTKWLFGQKEKE